MPARSTLFVWLRQRPEFRQRYTFSKWFQCQWMADEMVDIADGQANVQSREFSASEAADSCAPLAYLEAEAEEIPLVVANYGQDVPDRLAALGV
jgi:hypothetical protein